jgi:hypothetical protein
MPDCPAEVTDHTLIGTIDRALRPDPVDFSLVCAQGSGGGRNGRVGAAADV